LMAFNTLFVDLGDVLCDWDRDSITALTPTTLLQVMHSIAWYRLECGEITATEAYELLSDELCISSDLIREAFLQARATLVIDRKFVGILEALKKDIPGLNIYIASNISDEHFNWIKDMPLPWSIFTGIFTSAQVGLRKPGLGFFRHITDTTGCDPSRTIFIDNKPENLCGAQSIGMRGILAKPEFPVFYGLLWSLFSNPVHRAMEYLKNHAGRHDSVIEGRGMSFKDNFSQLLIWGITGDPSLIYLKRPSSGPHNAAESENAVTDSDTYVAFTRNSQVKAAQNQSDKLMPPCLWNYFCEQHALNGKDFPADADTTSIAYLTLPKESLDASSITSLLDVMAKNVSSDGIMQVYLIERRPRVCPVVCCNILRLFYRFGRGDDARIKATEAWVIQCLATRAYQHGTRHYTTAESFLYFTALWYSECGSASLRSKLDLLLRDALIERVHVPVNPLALAMRIAACQAVGIDQRMLHIDINMLLEIQDRDGGWPPGHFCRFGSTGDKVGNRGITTALAANILKNSAGLLY
ncbi:HAD-like domain-containing protein, partial [Mariannaea sp. PMI_226]